MLMDMKQNNIKLCLHSFLVSIIFFVGCTNKILYNPPKTEGNLSNAFEYKLQSIHTIDGETLSAVEYYTYKKNNKGIVLFLHGNAENIYTASTSALAFVELGYDVLILDYRGYGKSTGSPSPKGLSFDINATINYLTKEFNNIFIYAQSIGGTSLLGTLDDVNKTKLKAIAVEGSFLSYKQLSKEYGFSIPFTDYEELDSYAPISTDRNLTIPLMIIHSEEDEIIPYSQGLMLSKHFIKSQHVKTIGRHLGYFDYISNYEFVSKFFEKNKKDENQTEQLNIKLKKKEKI